MSTAPLVLAAWSVASVEEQPELRLFDWSIYEVTCPLADGAREAHVVGYCRQWAEGRVSSFIDKYLEVRKVDF